MLGTNPISIAFPADVEPPIIIDLATCAAAYGKIEIANRTTAKDIPEGWTIDKEGNQNTKPEKMINGGASLPLGSDRERGGHKGYGLAIMVDFLALYSVGLIGGRSLHPLHFVKRFQIRVLGKELAISLEL